MSIRIRIRTRIAARLSSLRGTPARLAAVAGIVTFAILAGTTSSYAYFQMTQQASTSATAGTLAVTTSNFTALAYTFRNDQLDTVGSFTVTNSSDAGSPLARSLAITLSATGDSAALNNIRYIATLKGTAACAAKNTVSGGVLAENQVGTLWSAPTTFTTSLSPGASVTYCVESYIRSAASISDGDGTVSLAPSVTAALAAGGWSSSTADTTLESSLAIYPADTTPMKSWWFVHPVSDATECVDDANYGTVSGSAYVISFPCKDETTGNQQWRFSAGGTAGTVEMANRYVPGLRADSVLTTSGSEVKLVTDANAATQSWIPQRAAGTSANAAAGTATYQFVNLASRLCLAIGGAGTNGWTTMVQAPCTGLATQRFTLELAKLEGFGCSTYGSGSNQRIQYAWSNAYNAGNNGPYTFTTSYGGQSRVIAVSASATATSVQVTGSSPTGAPLVNQASGTYAVTVTDAEGLTVMTTQVTVASNASGKYLAC